MLAGDGKRPSDPPKCKFKLIFDDLVDFRNKALSSYWLGDETIGAKAESARAIKVVAPLILQLQI